VVGVHSVVAGGEAVKILDPMAEHYLAVVGGSWALVRVVCRLGSTTGGGGEVA
jgi:hypothetical protein